MAKDPFSAARDLEKSRREFADSTARQMEQRGVALRAEADRVEQRERNRDRRDRWMLGISVAALAVAVVALAVAVVAL